MNRHTAHSDAEVTFLYTMTLPPSADWLAALNRAKFELVMNVSDGCHGDYTSKDGLFFFRFHAPSTYAISFPQRRTGQPAAI